MHSGIVRGVMWTSRFPLICLFYHLLPVISKKYVCECQIFDIWMINKAQIIITFTMINSKTQNSPAYYYSTRSTSFKCILFYWLELTFPEPSIGPVWKIPYSPTCELIYHHQPFILLGSWGGIIELINTLKWRNL